MQGPEPKAALRTWQLGTRSPGCLFPRPRGPHRTVRQPGRVCAGQGLSVGLQVVVELLRLGLQALEFLLDEVGQGFAHLHLRGRTRLSGSPPGAAPRGRGKPRGAGRGEGQPGAGGKLTVDLFSARSCSSTGRTLKGLPISTVIFCRDTGHRVIRTGGVPTAPAQLPWGTSSRVLPLTCLVLPLATLPLNFYLFIYF